MFFSAAISPTEHLGAVHRPLHDHGLFTGIDGIDEETRNGVPETSLNSRRVTTPQRHRMYQPRNDLKNDDRDARRSAL